MTNEEIWKKVVKKAVKNGWKGYDDSDWFMFEHDFAKAFWGEKNFYTNTFEESWDDGDGYIDGGNEIYLPAWEYHLRIMVLKEEPLKYLEKFIN